MYKCLQELAPDYFVKMCDQVSATAKRRHLCSLAQGDLVVQRQSLGIITFDCEECTHINVLTDLPTYLDKWHQITFSK